MDYILQPPTERDDSKNNQSSKMLIFCIDISGSMCVSTGKYNTHRERERERERIISHLFHHSQKLLVNMT